MTASAGTTFPPSVAMKLTKVMAVALRDLDSRPPPLETWMILTVQPRASPKDLRGDESEPQKHESQSERNVPHLSSSGTSISTALAGWLRDTTTTSLLITFCCTATWGQNRAPAVGTQEKPGSPHHPEPHSPPPWLRPEVLWGLWP